MTDSNAAAAGWYQDPSEPSQLRWFDGQQWTAHVHAHVATAAAQVAAAVPQQHYQQQPQQFVAQQQYAQQPQQYAPATGQDPRFAHDRFVVRQWRRMTVHKYEVHVASGPGPKPDAGALVTYVQQKRLSMKEKISFYTGTDKTQQVLGLQAQKALSFAGSKHDVLDAQGAVVGHINRATGKSMFVRSTWNLHAPDGRHLALVHEESKTLAILRRYGAFIPYAGAIFEMIPYAFSIHAGEALAGQVPAGAVLGTHRRRWGFRDVYDMDLTPDSQHLLDRRIMVALAIALDALQRR